MNLSDRNIEIQNLMTNGDNLKNFYRFASQNPHIELHDACQIVIARSDASVCFSFEEWNALGRRINRGSKGIPYYDRDGNKLFVFDANDTHGDKRYQRMTLPMKHLVDGLDVLNDTNVAGGERGDFRKIHTGVGEYLKEAGYLSGDTERNRLFIEGLTYSLYCKTGFPNGKGIELSGLPYSLTENAELFKEIYAISETLAQEVEDAYLCKQLEVKVVDDTEEDAVTDEPVKTAEPLTTHVSFVEQQTETKQPISSFYQRYLVAQNEYPDSVVLIKLGDFYEVMGENAVTVSQELDLTLTGRDVGLSERIPMCGFPYHVTEKYVEKMLENHRILLIEDDVEPKYILSYAEAQEIPDYVNVKVDIDENFQSQVGENDEQSDEVSEQKTGEDDILVDNEEIDEFDIGEEDFDDVDFDANEDEEKEPQTKEKPKGKPISQRKRKEKPQPNLLDLIEGTVTDEPPREELLKEWGLQYGSNVENGKFRIYDEYRKDPTVKEFAFFLKKEYGWGGFYGSGQEMQSDGKGLAFAWRDREHPENDVVVNLKWEQAATEIADLIDEDKYFTETEKQQLSFLQKSRAERINTGNDEEKINVIVRQFIDSAIKQTWTGEYELEPYRFEESAQFICEHQEELKRALLEEKEVVEILETNFPYQNNIRVKLEAKYCPRIQKFEDRSKKTTERIQTYADGFIRDCAEHYADVNLIGEYIVWNITPKDMELTDYLFLKDNRDEFTEYLQSKNGVESADFSMQSIEIKFKTDFIKFLNSSDYPIIKSVVDSIIEEGTKNTSEGNWVTYFDEFDNEQFVRDHLDEIISELGNRKEVSEVELTDDAIDTSFYLDFCPKYEDIYVDEDDEDYEEEEEELGDVTNLINIGFDQSELGGAKQRYRSNLEAIRLMNMLYDEDRNPTQEEKKVLAKYVGWGGLASVFDEHNAQWQKEYEELKAALTTADYERAKGSVLNAHYTSKDVIEGMYQALARLGVKGNNRVLEPAMGTGNFFGYMLRVLAEGAALYGVELDNVTGRIAAKLYPQVKVQVKGFEETSFPNDHFDIVVSNVPFGGYGVADSDYNRYKFLIHDYFIAKSLDKVRANGIVAVITSKGTMDKLNSSVRKYLADRAELLGAIRLPNNAFKQTANTEVVTDILFFQKREEQINADTENTEWLSTGKSADGYEINEYFIHHPEMILGTLAEEHGLYGAIDVTVKPDGRKLTEALSESIQNLPENVYENHETPQSEQEEVEVDYNIKPLNYKAEHGRLYMRIGERMVEQEIPKTPRDAYERINGMIALRSQLRYLLDIQTNGCSDEQLQNEKRILNANYDQFVRRYGYLNTSTNSRLFREDGDSALLFACEELSEDKKSAKKTDVFNKRTIRPYAVVASTDDCFEALQISKNEHGCVDIAFIEELTKKDFDIILSELGDAIFRNPVKVNESDKYSGYETAEEYLSGKVVQKLHTAKTFAEEQPDKGYERNVAALTKMQPEPLTASDISVRIGASWVDKEYYKQFICQLLVIPWYYEDGVELYFNPHDSSWRVDKSQYVRASTSMAATEVYGTSRANAYRLFEDCLNLRATNIYDTVEEDGRVKRVLNQTETIAAREKQNKIKEAFKDWIFSDPIRREELEATYNRLFNQIRLPSYDGSYLKFPEMNPTIELRQHQKNAIHRIITSGNTLLHHVVGSGKTYTIAATVMKLRQYGLAKKPMIAVPNHLVEQWAGEFRTLYPNAKLLIASKEDLAKENRKRFVSKVALGDWDAVIIAQSSFAKIPISEERQIKKIHEEISHIEDTIDSLYENSEYPRGAVKNLERIKKSRETMLKRLLDNKNKDSILKFEDLGVDYLFVDEAHFYKNKFLYTKMNNVAGVSTTASQRAADLELKVEYINELHGGDKGVVFATGTPISNSMTEMYTMQSYLQKRTLEEIGINYFDGWAADFGETVTSLELAPSGQGYKPRTRFAKFTNLPELQTLYRMFADVQTADMVKLDVPIAERKIINLKPSDTVIELAESIAKRADEINGGGVDPHIDNMLKITSDGKKLALDARCFDPMADDEKGSKLNAAAEYIYEIWEDTAEKRSAQIVFCDLSTPKRTFEEYEYGKNFDAYNDLKYKLTERGIPENEIAYIHDVNTDIQKQELFKKVNAGQVRVLIGSTEKCGAGTNAQKRLIALHHLDTPYRPSDMEQREGRIIRQGNTNDTVQIFTYVTERTFDSYSYQILENKQQFISQICRGDLTAREADDIDETTLSYAEIKAITAANSRIKLKMEVDSEVAKLRVLEGQYKKSLYSLQDKVNKTLPEQIKKQTLFIERLKEDAERLKEQYNPDVFSISVKGVTYTDKKEGSNAFTDALYASKPDTVVAEYCGFKISMNPIDFLTVERSVTIAGSGQYSMEIGVSASRNITRLDNIFAEFPNKISRAEQKLEQLKQDLITAGSQLDVPFEHKERLMTLLNEQSELNAELDLNRREEVVIDDADSASEEENYAALPERRAENFSVKEKHRKPLDKYSMEAYDKQRAEVPDAYIFVKNVDKYELFGEQAERYAAEHDVPIISDTVDGERTVVLSLDISDLNKAVGSLVEHGNNVRIIETLIDKKEEEFIDNIDKVAAMEVALLPDYSVSQVQMHEYGYKWDGMLPLCERIASRLWNTTELQIYRLEKDGTETDITDNTQFIDGALYGIEKPEWNNYLENELTTAYLAGRLFVTRAADMVASEDLSYMDASFIDGFIDNNYEERVALTRYLRQKEMPDTEEINSYISELINEFSDRIATAPIEAYGWQKSDISHAIVDRISFEEVKKYAKEVFKMNSPLDGNRVSTAISQDIDYENEVIVSVKKEYEDFKSNLLSLPADEILNNNYQFHVFTELSSLIVEHDYLDNVQYRALYEDKGNILQLLYDEFLSEEYGSVNNNSDTADFIISYNERFHSDILEAEEQRKIAESVTYLGKDEENNAYYYFHNALNIDNLSAIKEEANNYFIVAPVCYLSEKMTVDKNIYFLKIGRDISEEDLKDSKLAFLNIQKKMILLDAQLRRSFMRKTENEIENEDMQDKTNSDTVNGYKVINIVTDKDNRKIAVLRRRKDYMVAMDYDTENGDWRYGFYDFDTQEDAEQYRAAYFNINEQIDKAKEKVMVSINVVKESVIKKYDNHTFMKMPNTGKFAGYTYNVSNNRIKVDEQDGYLITFANDSMIKIRDRIGNVEEITVEEFKELVKGKTADDYTENRKRVQVSVPKEALRNMFENSSLFVLPNTVENESFTFFIPNSFAREDIESEDGRILLLIPEDFIIKAQNRKGEKNIELTAQELCEKCNDTVAENYVFNSESKVEKDDIVKERSDWNIINIDKAARIATYDNATLFRMPSGEYENFVYYVPNKLIKENEDEHLHFSIPKEFVIRLTDKKNDKEINLTADEYINQVRDKSAASYELYRKPSEEDKRRFEVTKKRLNDNIPDEMKVRTNWVAVRTRWNENKNKLDKYLINCHTGKFAESNNPETWTNFYHAIEYARENGCATIAYALDGKDNICCIDLDHCIDDKGEMTPIAHAVKDFGGSYCERSVSGSGVHFFGKTAGLNVRTFSKDGDLEFYQKDHFIAMTGDLIGGNKLINIDGTRIQELIEAKCEKRTEWKGAGKGFDGLSVMSDRDVVDKAISSKNGDTFKALYSGQDLQNNHSNSDMSLMNHLAFWCNGDKEQMLRIFATSGLYRGSKSANYYEGTAIKAVKDTTNRFQLQDKIAPKPTAMKQSDSSAKC